MKKIQRYFTFLLILLSTVTFSSLFGSDSPQHRFNFFSKLQTGVCAGTLVATPDGYTAIENIVVGDMILNPDNQPCKVQCIMHYSVHEHVQVTIGGQKIFFGAKQRLYVHAKNKWVAIKDITTLDAVAICNGQTICCDEIIRINHPIELYELSVQGHAFTITSSKIAVHNLVFAVAGIVTIAINTQAAGVLALGTLFMASVHVEQQLLAHIMKRQSDTVSSDALVATPCEISNPSADHDSIPATTTSSTSPVVSNPISTTVTTSSNFIHPMHITPSISSSILENSLCSVVITHPVVASACIVIAAGVMIMNMYRNNAATNTGWVVGYINKDLFGRDIYETGDRYSENWSNPKNFDRYFPSYSGSIPADRFDARDAYEDEAAKLLQELNRLISIQNSMIYEAKSQKLSWPNVECENLLTTPSDIYYIFISKNEELQLDYQLTQYLINCRSSSINNIKRHINILHDRCNIIGNELLFQLEGTMQQVKEFNIDPRIANILGGEQIPDLKKSEYQAMHKNCRHYLQLLADLEKRLHIVRWYFTKHNAHYDSITVPQFENEMANVSVDAIMMFIQQKINELKQPVIDCNTALCKHTQKKFGKDIYGSIYKSLKKASEKRQNILNKKAYERVKQEGVCWRSAQGLRRLNLLPLLQFYTDGIQHTKKSTVTLEQDFFDFIDAFQHGQGFYAGCSRISQRGSTIPIKTRPVAPTRPAAKQAVQQTQPVVTTNQDDETPPDFSGANPADTIAEYPITNTTKTKDDAIKNTVTEIDDATSAMPEICEQHEQQDVINTALVTQQIDTATVEPSLDTQNNEDGYILIDENKFVIKRKRIEPGFCVDVIMPLHQNAVQPTKQETIEGQEETEDQAEDTTDEEPDQTEPAEENNPEDKEYKPSYGRWRPGRCFGPPIRIRPEDGILITPMPDKEVVNTPGGCGGLDVYIPEPYSSGCGDIDSDFKIPETNGGCGKPLVDADGRVLDVDDKSGCLRADAADATDTQTTAGQEQTDKIIADLREKLAEEIIAIIEMIEKKFVEHQVLVANISIDTTAAITIAQAEQLQNLATKIQQLKDFVKLTENFTKLDNLSEKDTMYLNRILNVMQERALILEFLQTHKPFIITAEGIFPIENLRSIHIHAGDIFAKERPAGAHSNFGGDQLDYFTPEVTKQNDLGVKDVVLTHPINGKTKDSTIYPEYWSEFMCDLKAIQAAMSSTAKFKTNDAETIVNIVGKTSEGIEIALIYDIKTKTINTHYPTEEGI